MFSTYLCTGKLPAKAGKQDLFVMSVPKVMGPKEYKEGDELNPFDANLVQSYDKKRFTKKGYRRTDLELLDFARNDKFTQRRDRDKFLDEAHLNDRVRHKAKKEDRVRKSDPLFFGQYAMIPKIRKPVKVPPKPVEHVYTPKPISYGELQAPVRKLGKGKVSSVYTKEERLSFRKSKDEARTKKRAAKKARQRTNFTEKMKSELPVTESLDGRTPGQTLYEDSFLKPLKMYATVWGTVLAREFFTAHFPLSTEITSSVAFLVGIVTSPSPAHTIALTSLYWDYLTVFYTDNMWRVRMAELEQVVANLQHRLSTVHQFFNNTNGLTHYEYPKEGEPKGNWHFHDVNESKYDADIRKFNEENFSDDEKDDDREFPRVGWILESALSDALLNTGSGIDMIIDSPVVNLLRESLLSLVSIHLFEKDYANKIKRVFGQAKRKYTVIELISLLSKTAGTMIVAYERFQEGAPFNEIFFTKKPYEECMMRYKKLIAYEKALYFGLPKEGHMCAKDFVKEARVILPALEAFSKKVNPYSADYMPLYEAKIRLSMVLEKTNQRVLGGNRKTPMCIVLAGLPGIGKTSIMRLIKLIYADVFGKEFSDDMVYTRMRNSDYWDGYDMHPIVFFSEVGTTKSSIVKQKGDPRLEEITSLLDGNSMTLNMSSVDQKGVVQFLADLIVIDTNCPDMNIEELFKNSSAYKRRFLYVNAVLKQKYCADGVGTLDPNALDDETTYEWFNKWNYDMWYHVPTSNTSGTDKYLMRASKESTVEDFVKSLTTQMHKHYGKQEKAMKKFAATLNDILVERDADFDSSDSEELLSDALFNDDVSDNGDLEYSDLWSDDGIEEVDFEGRPEVESLEVPIFIAGGYEKLSLFAVQTVDHWKSIGAELGKFVFLWVLMAFYYTRDVFMDISVRNKVICSILLLMISYFLGYFLWTISATFVLSLILFSNEILMTAEDAVQGAIIKSVDKVKSNLLTRLFSYKNYILKKSPSAYTFYAASMFVLTASMITLLYSFFDTGKPIPESEELDEGDDKMEASNSYARAYAKSDKVWNTTHIKPSVHKGPLEELSNRVGRNCRPCMVHLESGTQKTMIFGVKSSYAIIHGHAINDGKEDFKISYSQNNSMNDMRESHINGKRRIQLAEDIWMIELNTITFSDVTAHFPVDTPDFGIAEARIDGHQTVAKYLPKFEVERDDKKVLCYQNGVAYKWPDHEKGKCGHPVTAFRDSGSCIVGIHSAGHLKNQLGFAITLTREMVTNAIKNLVRGRDTFERCSLNIDKLVSESIEIHPKSPFMYEYYGHIDHFGAKFQPLLNNRSSLKRTKLDIPEFERYIFDVRGYIRSIDDMFDRPFLRPHVYRGEFVSPYNNAVRKMAIKRKPLDGNMMDLTTSEITSYIIRLLEGRNVSLLKPWDVRTSINGELQDAFCRRMNLSTSSGYGLVGSKRDNVIEESKDMFMPAADLDNDLLKQRASWVSGVLYHSPFVCCIKDEPRSIPKIQKGKERIFWNSSMSSVISARQMLGPLYSLMVQHGDIFHTAIGIDMHRDADGIYVELENFSSFFFEGDYGGYDQSMPPDVSNEVATIKYRVLKHFGYNQEALTMLTGVLSEELYPVTYLVGELIGVPGAQPSGKYGTAEDNSLKNLYLVVYFFNTKKPSANMSFWDYVLGRSYGDDIIQSVKESVIGWYNCQTYSRFCSEVYGMTFTTVDKTDNHVPTKQLLDTGFLKRNPRFHDGLQKKVAALDLASILRALEWTNPSDSVGPYEQIKSSLSSITREWFFHCSNEDEYLDFVLIVQRQIEEKYPNLILDIPTYYALLDDLCPTNYTVEGGRQHAEVCSEGIRGFLTESKLLCMEKSMPRTAVGLSQSIAVLRLNKTTLLLNKLSELNAEAKELEAELESLTDPCAGIPYRIATQLIDYRMSPRFRARVEQYHSIRSKLQAINLTVTRFENYLHKENLNVQTVTESLALPPSTEPIEWNTSIYNHYDYDSLPFTESEQVADAQYGEVKSDVIDIMENLTDIAGTAAYVEDMLQSSVPNVGQVNHLDIDDFFCRPIALGSYSINVGSHLTTFHEPTKELLDHPSIRAKLRNMAWFRATTCVRVTCAAPPQNAGKVLISPQVLFNINENLTGWIDGQLAGPGRFQSLCYLSQAPGAKVVDIKYNQPVDIRMPFVSPQPVIRLYNKSPLILPDTTAFDDSVGFNKIYINTINPVSSISATAPSTTLFVYAWFEDVELGPPTGTVIQIATESMFIPKKSTDEREVGPIERVATNVAGVSAMLGNVPTIGPLAKASSVFLNEVASVASWFGWSRPSSNVDIIRMKNEPLYNGAQTITMDMTQRMCLDPMQELTVDPRVCGSDEDDMSLSVLSSKESLLDVFTWAETDNPLSTAIWTIPVNPAIYKRRLLAGTTYVGQPTTLGFTAAPFYYWHGDITVRFEFVTNNFTRGKVAILFEPNVSQNVVIDTALDLNKQYIKVVDLQQSQNVEVVVKWAYPKAWARVMNFNQVGTLGEVGYLGSTLADFANGYLAIIPFTRLQNPDGSNIEVNVYIRSDNMVFNQLTSLGLPSTRPTAESLAIDVVENMVLNESSASTDNISTYHFGETPVSFRQLLKRFAGDQIPSVLPLTYTAGHYLIKYVDQLYPPPLPAYNGLHSNLSNIHLLSYLRYAYVGIRGGTKHRFGMTGIYDLSPMSQATVQYTSPVAETINRVFVSSTQYIDATSQILGTITSVPSTNGGLEFECCYYSPNLFGAAFNSDFNPSALNSNFEAKTIRGFTVTLPVASITSASVFPQHTIATAEDFNLMRYQGAPVFEYTL